jgi:hypothetical protein
MGFFSFNKRSRLTLPAVTAALGPARALTSHLRKRFETHYRGRHRFPRSAFLFDLVLVGVVAGLVVTNLVFAFLPPSPPADLRLSVLAPSLITATPQAFEARLISNGSEEFRNVHLTWELPPHTEILFADPPLSANQETFVGTIAPGETKIARIAVRLFVPPGSSRVGFKVRTAGREFRGEDIRPVTGSGLRFEPLVQAKSIPEGGAVPFLLKNETNRVIEAVDILALQGATVDGRDHRLFEQLVPGSHRILFFQPNEVSLLKAEALVRGVPLVQSEQTVTRHQDQIVRRLEISSRASEKKILVNVEAEKPVKVLVYHPGLAEAEHGLQVLSVSGTQQFTLPLRGWIEPIDRWFALPFVEGEDGVRLGDLVQEKVVEIPDLAMSARYYASSGDQIGLGPLPPRVGETTNYWIQWKMTPSTTDLKDVKVQTRLSPGVILTGRSALPQGGALSQMGDGVLWTIPSLPAGSDPVTVSFEVALTPTSVMRGTVPEFHFLVTLTGVDPRTGDGLVEASYGPGLDANLLGDAKAEGKGMVE